VRPQQVLERVVDGVVGSVEGEIEKGPGPVDQTPLPDLSYGSGRVGAPMPRETMERSLRAILFSASAYAHMGRFHSGSRFAFSLLNISGRRFSVSYAVTIAGDSAAARGVSPNSSSRTSMRTSFGYFSCSRLPPVRS
jgi:hypothetical protein